VLTQRHRGPAPAVPRSMAAASRTGFCRGAGRRRRL